MNRKHFLSLTGVSTLGLVSPASIFSSKVVTKNKISLAQWSMNKSFFSGNKDPYDFAIHAAAMGFDGIEYVNQFYFDQLKTELFQAKRWVV